LTALWAWSQKGVLVATDDVQEAFDDLKWLNIEADEIVPTDKRSHYQTTAEALVADGKAYHCYCSRAELREMNATPHGSPEAIVYEGRCRDLTAEDKKALSKAGRIPSVRLLLPEDPASVLPKRLHAFLPKQIGDFVIFNDGEPTTPFAAAVNDKLSDTTHSLLHKQDGAWVHQRSLVLAALDSPIPSLSFVPDAAQVQGDAPRSWTTIGHLRDTGYHPAAVQEVLLAASWATNPGKSLRESAKDFQLAEVSKDAPQIDLAHLQSVNANVLQGLPKKEQTEVVVAHLERRGFSFGDRNRKWQTRFVSTLMDNMQTMSDAEGMASLVLTTTVNYDRTIAELLRDQNNQKLLDVFEDAIVKGKTNTGSEWRRTLAEFRAVVDIPGRALTILRLALTGERTGPSLPYLLTLLGEDGCRFRLQKARRYKS
jgi:nondiscriminating glutamyl-tRNA synthetase